MIAICKHNLYDLSCSGGNDCYLVDRSLPYNIFDGFAR